MTTITECIRPYVQHIQNDARNGDPLARQVIETHQTYCNSFEDPTAELLCEAAFKSWKDAKFPEKKSKKAKVKQPW